MECRQSTRADDHGRGMGLSLCTGSASPIWTPRRSPWNSAFLNHSALHVSSEPVVYFFNHKGQHEQLYCALVHIK